MSNAEDRRYERAASSSADNAVVMMVAFRGDAELARASQAAVERCRHGRLGAEEDAAVEAAAASSSTSPWAFGRGTKVARLLYQKGLLRMYLKHGAVGGGDFVNLLRDALGGRRPTLPSVSTSLLERAVCVAKALPRTTQLFLRPALPPLATTMAGPTCTVRSVYKISDLPGGGPSARVSSRCRLLARVLEDVATCMTWPRREMLTWLPVAFEPAGPQERNSVGIVPFSYTLGASPADVEAEVDASKDVAVATRLALGGSGADSFWPRVGVGAAKEDVVRFFRERVECVVSMIVCDSPQDSAPASEELGFFGGFLRHVSPLAYPAYVLCATINGFAHVTYSFSGGRFDGTKLPGLRPAEATLLHDPCLSVRSAPRAPRDPYADVHSTTFAAGLAPNKTRLEGTRDGFVS